MAGADVIPCLAEELEVQVLRLEAAASDFENLYGESKYFLPTDFRGNSSLFEQDCFLDADLCNLCDLTHDVPGSKPGRAPRPGGESSQGPSSAGSCEYSAEADGTGLEWSSLGHGRVPRLLGGRQAVPANMASDLVYADGIDLAGNPATILARGAPPPTAHGHAGPRRIGVDHCFASDTQLDCDREPEVEFCRKNAEQLKVPLQQQQRSMYGCEAGAPLCSSGHLNQRSGSPVYRSSFIPAPRMPVPYPGPSPSWGSAQLGPGTDAPMPVGGTLRVRKPRFSDSIVSGQFSGDTTIFGAPQCHSPLSGGSAAPLDLGGPGEGLVLASMGSSDTDAAFYSPRHRKYSAEGGSVVQESRLAEGLKGCSPRATGTKRPGSGSGLVARKLMTHPEGLSCTQCGVQSTPVWRAGPLGPKTLCNACGVRYSKIARKK